jgi:hypothetical protein
MWGHSSLVMAELAGYFEFLQLSSDWKYVVNLSGYDYPIRSNDVVYDELKNNFDTMNLIEHWSSSDGELQFFNVADFVFLAERFSLV